MTPREAYYLALEQGPADETRVVACQDPYWAEHYAFRIDCGYAYLYALNVDKCARDDTRAAACQDPRTAYRYAFHIDQDPRDDTRVGARQDPMFAYRYALMVDKFLHPVTLQALPPIELTLLRERFEFD